VSEHKLTILDLVCLLRTLFLLHVGQVHRLVLLGYFGHLLGVFRVRTHASLHVSSLDKLCKQILDSMLPFAHRTASLCTDCHFVPGCCPLFATMALFVHERLVGGQEPHLLCVSEIEVAFLECALYRLVELSQDKQFLLVSLLLHSTQRSASDNEPVVMPGQGMLHRLVLGPRTRVAKLTDV